MTFWGDFWARVEREKTNPPPTPAIGSEAEKQLAQGGAPPSFLPKAQLPAVAQGWVELLTHGPSTVDQSGASGAGQMSESVHDDPIPAGGPGSEFLKSMLPFSILRASGEGDPNLMGVSGPLYAGLATGRLLSGLRPPTGPSMGMVPGTLRSSLDPGLLDEVGEALETTSTVTVYHGGVLDNGQVGSRTFSTTPELSHAEQYAAMRRGEVTTFQIPRSRFLEMQEEGSVTVQRDLLEGTDVPSIEYRFRASVAPELNNYRVGKK